MQGAAHKARRAAGRDTYAVRAQHPALPPPAALARRMIDDPLSEAMLHHKFAPGTCITMGLGLDGQVEVYDGSTLRPLTTLARHPSGVEGGILVTDDGSGSVRGGWHGDSDVDGSEGSEADLAPQRVFLTATMDMD